jgi:hypothetical protein
MKFPFLNDEIKNVIAKVHELESDKLSSVDPNSISHNDLVIRFIISFLRIHNGEVR